MGTWCCKQRAVVVDICPRINWPKNDIECKAQDAPEHFGFHELTASDLRFPAGSQRALPVDVKPEPQSSIDDSKYEQNEQEPGSGLANAGTPRHASCPSGIRLLLQ